MILYQRYKSMNHNLENNYNDVNYNYFIFHYIIIMFNTLKKMCKPATVYFILSVVTLIVMILSNIGNRRTFCMGEFECPVDNLFLIYLIKLGYILFTTIVLDSLCKNGYASISWFLVFFPLLAYFVSLGLYMVYRNSMVIVVEDEGMFNMY